MSERKFEASKTVELEDGTEEKREAAVFMDFGDNLDEMVEVFDEDTVYKLAFSKADSKVKSAIRKLLGEGIPPEEVPQRLSSWKPGVTLKVTANPEQESENLFAQMTPEQQEAHLEKLRAKLAARQG